MGVEVRRRGMVKPAESLVDALNKAINNDDMTRARSLLDNPALANQLRNFCGKPPLASAKSREMADLLIEKGASVDLLSAWWAPGFGTREIDTDVASHLVERGATITAHAAAGLGLTQRLEAMLDADRELVNSKGGDSARPLHFARHVEVAQLLLDRGAEVDPRDDDHRSTPAQWLVGDAPEVTRLLLDYGAVVDIFIAVALGDLELVRRVVLSDPDCTGYRIGNNLGPFPGIGFEGTGGTILQWSVGFNCAPHEVALNRGYQEVYNYLLERTAPLPKLLAACMVGDEALARSIAAENPGILDTLDEDGQSLLARACWETNHNNEAVRIMLDLGFPVSAPERNHGYSPLHNAAWDGNVELVKLLIAHGHPIGERDPAYNSTPLGWCIHAATEARCGTNDYAGVVDCLLEAGAEFDRKAYPVGHAAIDAVLQKRLNL